MPGPGTVKLGMVVLGPVDVTAVCYADVESEWWAGIVDGNSWSVTNVWCEPLVSVVLFLMDVMKRHMTSGLILSCKAAEGVPNSGIVPLKSLSEW